MSLPITNSKRLIGAHHHPQNERNKPISIFTSRPIRRLMFLILFILTILMFIKLTPSQHIQSIKSTSTDYLRQQFNAVKGGVTSGAGESCSAPPLNNQFNSPSNRTEKPKAAFIALVRDRQLGGLLATMRDVQIAFNDQPENGYDYIFLSEAKFSDFFKNSIKNFLEEFPSKPKVHFGVVPKEDWQVPSHIDMEKAKKRWETMGMSKIVPYGGSQTYRQMCRFYSGPIYHHELLKDYEYVWRIEPDTKHSCKYVSQWQKGQDGITRWIERDPFRHMKETGKKYGFIIAMHEFRITVKTLFVHVNKWRKDNAHLIPKDNLINFVSDDGMGFNMCHFWTNYEIIDLSFVRSNAYQSFFNHLDSVGGFFYERWGDAPVRSIAASLLLNKDEIWHVDYAGYFHPPYGTCPRNQDPNSQCACDPHMNVDYDLSHISCKAKWDDAIGNNSTDIIVKLSEENGFPGMTWDKLTPPFVPPPRRITD